MFLLAAVLSGEVVVDEPIGGLTPKFSIVLVHKDGKPSKTTFQRLHYDGVTSVVKCRSDFCQGSEYCESCISDGAQSLAF